MKFHTVVNKVIIENLLIPQHYTKCSSMKSLPLVV